ncbi:DinB family protein [Flavobacterium alkalisoli]|uniref:DinB family protein n=1 Tax=Flavobacterium alkalisoli TaxID=2602769 RepID=A0A5B9FUZ5_9FLAO|nr:DinB family protein [Flavobacterium alkalisoli]QEE50734.1 DinB family protein [Flavobacterium alkalisoli]
MDLIKLLQREMNQEALTTRKMLSRVPPEKFDWQPHPKSMTLGRLASHVAELPGWVAMVVDTDELDFANNPYEPKDVKNTGELLDYFEDSLKNGKDALNRVNIEQFSEPWTLRNGDQVYSTEPKYDVIRMAHSQVIHHRAQLGVYLRLLNIPIPGSYGPSADDVTF